MDGGAIPCRQQYLKNTFTLCMYVGPDPSGRRYKLFLGILLQTERRYQLQHQRQHQHQHRSADAERE